MSYFVYLVECADCTLYCGFTPDLVKRVAWHNAGKASKYTRSRLPVKLVYSESYLLRTDALKREYAIKRMSREEKWELVKSSKK
ncbi:MAG: GIY-YIG nuclease family protein [archaeon]